MADPRPSPAPGQGMTELGWAQVESALRARYSEDTTAYYMRLLRSPRPLPAAGLSEESDLAHALASFNRNGTEYVGPFNIEDWRPYARAVLARLASGPSQEGEQG